jgi:hypothetical protein
LRLSISSLSDGSFFSRIIRRSYSVCSIQKQIVMEKGYDV